MARPRRHCDTVPHVREAYPDPPRPAPEEKPHEARAHEGAPSPPREEVYTARRDRHARELERLEARSWRLGAARLGSFLAAAVCVVVAVTGTETLRLPWLLAAGILGIAFAILVGIDARLARRIDREASLRAVYERALARLARDWKTLDRLAPDPAPPVATRAAFVRDLHLFGHASLFRLLGTPGTPMGRRRLARWLTEPPSAPELPGEVALRQEAARALAPELDWRAGLEAITWGRPEEVRPEDAEARRRRAEADRVALERFYDWLGGEPWLTRRPLLLWSARVLAVATPVAFGLWIPEILGAPVSVPGLLGWPLWVPLAVVGYLLSARHAERMHETFDRATAGGDGLRGYGEILRWLEDLPGSGRRIDELRARLATDGRSAASWMDRLERLTVLSDTRRGLIYFFVQVLFLWDFHLQERFERWRAAVGPAARGWLEAVGEVEALASLAALAHAQPEWASPEIDPSADRFHGSDVGHPLIPDEPRVGNDVTVGPPGTFLLVTGSNMSGKTTLLRAVGTNAVLAQAGAPVCARKLRLPPVALATSIAVEDSLEQGVSFFLAELLRLKAVVEAAEGTAADGEVEGGRSRVLYLLDEVLRGTNSAERRVAVGRVIGRLLTLGAIGAVTTHDLEVLGETGEEGNLASAAVPIHFRETVRPRPEGGADMTFDYRARPGVATTTNALRLLEAVGLDDRGVS